MRLVSAPAAGVQAVTANLIRAENRMSHTVVNGSKYYGSHLPLETVSKGFVVN